MQKTTHVIDVRFAIDNEFGDKSTCRILRRLSVTVEYPWRIVVAAGESASGYGRQATGLLIVDSAHSREFYYILLPEFSTRQLIKPDSTESNAATPKRAWKTHTHTCVSVCAFPSRKAVIVMNVRIRKIGFPVRAAYPPSR